MSPSQSIRSRLRAGGATFVGALAASILLSGCLGRTPGGTGPTHPTQRTYGAARGSVASVTWDLPYGEPSTLDPANGLTFSATFMTTQLCDTLLRYGPDYSVQPNLATMHRTDPLTLVFDLRRGVRFWDGREMTAADVAYTLKHEFDPYSTVGLLFSTVKSVVATGRYQVIVHFKTPDELTPKEMPGIGGAIFEKAQAVKAGPNFGSSTGGIMCSGPYELRKWSPGSSIVLAANPRYWNPARAAHIRKLTVDFNSDSTSLAESMLSGQIDGAYEIPAEDIPRLSHAPDGHLLFGPAPLYLNLLPLNRDGPMGSLKLREALLTSIDRPALAAVVYKGAATPNYTFLNQNTWDPNELAIYRRAYEPFANAGATWGSPRAIAAARKLVAQSGYKGQSLGLVTLAGDQTLSQAAELIQQNAKQIGLKVVIHELQPIPYFNVSYSPIAEKPYALYLAVNWNAAPDPIELLQLFMMPGSVYNYLRFDNPAVTSLLTRARATYDPVEHARLIVQAQSLYERYWLGATLVNIDEISFLSDRLSGIETSFPYMMTPSLWSIGAAR